MKRIILSLIFVMSYALSSQAFTKEKEKTQDEFGTKTMISHLAKEGDFLDEMNTKLLLTPEQMEKMKMIIQTEKEGLETLQQKWMEILKNGTLSVEQRREERNKIDSEILTIAQKTKIDTQETLTTFQYNKFIPWLRRKWIEGQTPAQPEKVTNPFEQVKNPFESAPGSSEAKAKDIFLQAIEAQSKNNLGSLQETQNNPFANAPGTESESFEDIFTSDDDATDLFEEAIRKHNEGKQP